MKKYLIPQSGNFYKANLHCHTTVSDGRLTPEEVKALYKSKGYAIVAYTDHDVLIPHDELNDDSFLALHGFEVEITDPATSIFLHQKQCHICFVGIDPDTITQPFWNPAYARIGGAASHAHLVRHDESEPPYEQHYTGAAISEMMKEGREKGFFVTYNHPTWSLESYPEYMSYDGMDAFEMYNGSCIVAGYLDYNPRVYDDMLMGGKKLYCIGADDNHNFDPNDSARCDSGLGWTMIKAQTLGYRDVTDALVKGHFYASEGPEIHELCFEDGKVRVQCSEADRVVCSYGCRYAEIALAEDGKAVTSATFGMHPDWRYFRITIVGKDGKTACTNAYFAEDLYK